MTLLCHQMACKDKYDYYAKLFRKENAVDINRLEHEALTPPLLLADWSEHLNNEYRALLLLEQQMTKLKTELELFYSGKHPDDEVYKNKKVYGVDIRNLKLVKVQIQQYIDADQEYMDLHLKLKLQQHTVNTIEGYIKMIHQRNFLIKNHIDVLKFKAGAN